MGLKLIASCIEDQSLLPLRGLDESYFDEGKERQAYQTALDYQRDHDSCPTLQVFANEGIDLTVVRLGEATSYYRQRVVKRAILNKVKETYLDLGTALQSQDLDQTVSLVSQMGVSSRFIEDDSSPTDLVIEAGNVVSDYNFARNNPGLRGIPMGFPCLDECTLGAQGGDIIAIAGRTGVGKSWKLAKMSHASWRAGARVMVITMEMNRLQFTRRVVGLEARLNPMLIRGGTLGHWGEERLSEAMEYIQANGSRYHILGGDFDKSVDGIRPLFDDNEYDIVYIDAAYLLTPEGRAVDFLKSWEQIRLVIKSLKKIALGKNIPVVISVQLNRNQKKKSNREIDTGDVAGGDSIPQDVSVLIGLRLPPSPYDENYRIAQVVKNREGFEPSYSYYQCYEPMEIYEVDMDFDAPEETDGDPGDF